MKRFLLALLALALAWVASGQQNADETLVGLPQYGLTLTGTGQALAVHNNSGRTVTYLVLKMDYGEEHPSTYRPMKLRGVRPGDSLEGIPPGAVRSINTQMPAQVRTHVNGVDTTPPPPPPTVAVGLDGVIFSDGEFVGPDQGGKFVSLTEQFAAERELATLVAAARNDPTKREAAWAEVDRLRPGGHPPRTEDLLKMPLALMLFSTLQRQGEAAAYDLAEREMAVPKLWRAGH